MLRGDDERAGGIVTEDEFDKIRAKVMEINAKRAKIERAYWSEHDKPASCGNCKWAWWQPTCMSDTYGPASCMAGFHVKTRVQCEYWDAAEYT